LRPGELEQFLQSDNYSSTLRRTGDSDGSSTAKFQEPLVSKNTKCSKHGIGVDAKDGREVLGLRDPIPRAGLAFSDGTADLRRNLIVERGRIRTVDPRQHQPIGLSHQRRLDRTHNANDSSVMAVVQEGPPAIRDTGGALDPTNADLLFKEAKRRERRRRLFWLGVVVLLVVGVVLTVVAISSRLRTSPSPYKVSTSGRPKSTKVPIGSFTSLERAGPLAAGPTRALIVSDPTRHQVLVRQADGRFRVVAGNGKMGFAGDGGPATEAELSNVSAMAFAPNGDLYLADGSRVRAINQHGTISTVVGDGRSGSVANGTTALSAPLGSVASVAFSPAGQLYLATSHGVTSQLLRLTSTGQLDSVTAILPPGQVQMPGGLNGYGSIAVDSEGNIYASSLFDGWSIFKISPNGVATYLGYARRSGGTTAIVQRGPDDAIEVDDGQNILRVEGHHLVPVLVVSTVPGIHTFTFTDYFALGPDGTLYADNLGPPAFEPFQQIVSVFDGHGVSLWRGNPRQ
jgi:hypothetical protein